MNYKSLAIPVTHLSETPKSPYYFLSDIHLSTYPGTAVTGRTKDIVQLLEQIRRDKGTLFIVGDFFDFWFDCRDYVPPALEAVVRKLTALHADGVTVHYIGGNHDHWIPGYLTRVAGVRFYPEALSFQNAETRFYCVHGDQVVYNNVLYPLVRKILHAPAAIALLRLLPAKSIYRLGEKVSHYNRALSKIPRVPDRIVEEMQQFLSEKLREGYDIAVCGHVHQPRCRKEEAGVTVILGDWIHHRSYGFWDAQGFRLIGNT
jgi:UDP-2,3-diacylglucosamine hydrolase